MGAAGKLKETIKMPQSMRNAIGSFFEMYPLAPINCDRDFKEYKQLLLDLMRLRKMSSKDIDKLTMNGQYIKMLAHIIKEYEERKFGIPSRVPGVELLKFLMEQNNLTQRDLEPELGHQGNVSAILNGKRKFTVEQVKNLSKRFCISTDAFLAD
jgi:HTH-type transcriptional regulator/antitoxin HigA